MMLVALVLPLPAAGSDAPEIEFDVELTIPCQDITSDKYQLLQPEDKLIEVHLSCSTRLTAGKEKEIKELDIELISPDRRLRVVDFMPQTQLGTDVSGEIQITEDNKSERSFTGTLKPELTLKGGSPNAQISGGVQAASFEAKKDNSQGVVRAYKLLPKKDLLLASGTLNRGHGVYYKLKPSDQSSLQGRKEFVCICEVPRDWHCDWVLVTCGAVGYRSTFGIKREAQCGFFQNYVGLHQVGNAESAQLARELGRIEEKYADKIHTMCKMESESFFTRMGAMEPKMTFYRLVKFGQETKPTDVIDPRHYLCIVRDHKESKDNQDEICHQALNDALEKLAAGSGTR